MNRRDSGGERRGGGGRHNRGGSRRQGRGQGSGPNGDRAHHASGRSRERRTAQPGPTERTVDPKLVDLQLVPRRIGVVMFETFDAARAQVDALAQKAQEWDQLNIVIRAEGNMDDSAFAALERIKVYAGTAWATIHERRMKEGWYDGVQLGREESS